MNVLFETNVGSHMWKMNRPDSDLDIFAAYMLQTREFLAGHQSNSHFSTSEEVDRSSHELGVVVHQLTKGNVNFLWGIYSPIVISDSGALAEIRKIADVPGANCYHSIRGMAIHNLKLFLKREEKATEKQLNGVMRTVKFGIKILETGKVEFAPVSGTTMDSAEAAVKELEAAYANTSLPQEPLWRQELVDWMVEKRIGDL